MRAPTWSGDRRRSGFRACACEAAETVRRAGRQIHSTAERVDAARASATLAQERLESERRRFEVGLVHDLPRHAGAARPARGGGRICCRPHSSTSRRSSISRRSSRRHRWPPATRWVCEGRASCCCPRRTRAASSVRGRAAGSECVNMGAMVETIQGRATS